MVLCCRRPQKTINGLVEGGMANKNNNNSNNVNRGGYYYGRSGGTSSSGDGGGGGIEYLCEAFLRLPSATNGMGYDVDHDNDNDNDAVVSMRVFGNKESNGCSRNVLVVYWSGKTSTIPIEKNDDTTTKQTQHEASSSSSSAAAATTTIAITACEIQRLISSMKEKLSKLEMGQQSNIQNKVGRDSVLLLGYGLLYLLADVYGIYELHEELTHDDATMFGRTGKDDIMEFKKSYLPSSYASSSSRSSLVVPNYYIDSIHEIDVLNYCVVANFVCYIPGKEGKGTDVAKFDPSTTWKVLNVEAIRHGSNII